MIKGIFMTCGTCKHWRAHKERSAIGECRRYPPSVIYTGGEFRTAWPSTRIDGVCGEHTTEVSDKPKRGAKTRALTSGSDNEPITASAVIWQRYAHAYKQRYGVEPVRNAKVNAQFKYLNQRLGPDAQYVAEFYVTHPNALYVRAAHCTDLLLRDAEKLRTEWATSTRITESKAREQDRTAGNMDTLQGMLGEL